jgi:hypothetical protein
MNSGRIVLSAVAATVAYNLFGFLVFGLFPGMADYYRAYPGVFRPKETIMSYFPIGMAGMFIAILVLAVIYAKGYEGGNGAAEGARFGLLIAVFVIAAFVIHDYSILNVGHDITLAQAIIAIPAWTVTGMAIGLVHRPTMTSTPRKA